MHCPKHRLKSYWKYFTLPAAIALAASLLLPITLPAAEEKAPPPATAQLEAFQVKGFRSATFGMNEKRLRAAIARDFSISASDIKVETHPLEKTKVLMIDVPKLDIDAGPASISYILGYGKGKLIQVNTIWGNAAVPASKATLPELMTAAKDLVRYFSAYRFQPGSVAVNTRLGDGALQVFRAKDEKNHTVMLTLGALASRAANDKSEDKKPDLLFLRLSYVEDMENPDIFRIEQGKF